MRYDKEAIVTSISMGSIYATKGITKRERGGGGRRVDSRIFSEIGCARDCHAKHHDTNKESRPHPIWDGWTG